MADLGNRGAVDALINSILYDLAPNDSIQPSDHNGMLADILDTLANGLYTTLRTNNETGGIDIIITDGDGVQFGSGAFAGRIIPATLTGNNIYTLPDATGTIALTSDIDNIYNTDGTLTANRTVDMNGNELTLDNGVLKLANTGASSLMVFDPNSDVSTLSPGTTITAGQITNRQLGHLVVDIIANDNDDSFAIRSNKNNLGPNPVDTILKIVSTDGYETNFLNTTVIADARLKNNHFSFYNNSGKLGVKYKNNAGTVTPLSIGDNISNADLTWGASTTQDLNGNDLGFTGGNVGVGTATPDASSILDVNSTTQGSRAFPRVTTAQMNAISTPATNLVVFNTDLNALMRYDGANWVVDGYYGVCTVKNSNGVPTHYSNFYDAIQGCSANDTIYVHASHTVDCSASSVSWTWTKDVKIVMNGHNLVLINTGRIYVGGLNITIVGGGSIELQSNSINTGVFMFQTATPSNMIGDGSVNIFGNVGGSARGSFQQASSGVVKISGFIMKGSYSFCVRQGGIGRIYVDNCIMYTDLSTNVDAIYGDNVEVSNSTIYGRAFRVSGDYTFSGAGGREKARIFNNCTIIGDDADYPIGSREAIFNNCNITSFNREIRLGIGGEQEYNFCTLERKGTVGLAFIITNTSNVYMYHTKLISTGSGILTNLPMVIKHCDIIAKSGYGVGNTTGIGMIIEGGSIESTGGNCLSFGTAGQAGIASIKGTILKCNTDNNYCIHTVNNTTTIRFRGLDMENTADSADIYSRAAIPSENLQTTNEDSFGNIYN